VIDYFSIQWGRLKKVVFNLGDIFVFIGAAMLAVLEILRD
jgi:signal peptidase II